MIQTQIPVPVIKTWKDEIESQTGPAQIVSPLSDYLTLETAGCLTTKDKAFRRVIELGDFPKGNENNFGRYISCLYFLITLSCHTIAEFKTSDLETVLHSGIVKMKDYYDLRWVDDTHALVIFSDEITASMALMIKDPQIQFRPFYLACKCYHN